MPHVFKTPDPVTIAISLGGGQNLIITRAARLMIVDDDTGYRIDLGLATTTRIDNLIAYFKHMRIHALQDKED